ncbi:hypothetical protein SAMN04487948_11627 [Halogranum amylolyticum]|uniref:Uncharacterized protein n=1 Tax=Halogranum amylolyticum TaxID=660520 RepID=A0A1H8VEI2_9EURY|nr:hypothetical protein [Halogranum amylolyticum]SEP13799.1 hypothetical protein SAMN04487948_11627 [Halogranum amylolyticum]
MTLTFDASERFFEAAAEWAEQQMMDPEEAFEIKAEQALLEIEHLVSGAHEIEFETDAPTVSHHPSEELEAFLSKQAEATGLDESTLLKLHVDLYTRAFLRDDSERPPGTPPSGE